MTPAPSDHPSRNFPTFRTIPFFFFSSNTHKIIPKCFLRPQIAVAANSLPTHKRLCCVENENDEADGPTQKSWVKYAEQMCVCVCVCALSLSFVLFIVFSKHLSSEFSAFRFSRRPPRRILLLHFRIQSGTDSTAG